MKVVDYIKQQIKKCIPVSYWGWRRTRVIKHNLYNWNLFWNNRAIKYSDISNTKESKEALLLAEGHVLEKGITMPSRRLGFGYQKVRSLILHCNQWINEYGWESNALKFAISDLKEYKKNHDEGETLLPDDIIDGINRLTSKLKNEEFLESFVTTSEDYFSKTASFEELAKQRHSVRNYSSEPISVDRVIEAVRLAQTAPSACNRQGVRVKIINSKEKLSKVIALQNGNRGFGQLADKMILLTFEQGAIEYEYRASGYIDIGIFTMNLLYALHEMKICACTLNAHLTIAQMANLREIVGYSDTEIPVVFIMIGNAPQGKFMIARSRRLDLNDICTVV